MSFLMPKMPSMPALVQPEIKDVPNYDDADRKKAEREAREAAERAAAIEAAKPKQALDFVDQSKDPSYYVNRYNSESAYKDWFDTSYPDYTIWEGIGISQQEYRNILSDLGLLASPSDSTPSNFPLIIDLEDIEIMNIDERVANVKISFKITNPNYKSVILEMIRYSVFEDGTKIGTKSIGDRAAPGGLVSASNYFTILNDRPSIIKDEFTIMNDGNIPEIWSALQSDSADWRITGDAFYNLSSMTSGGENEINFDFVR